jgi:hypothetical protein
MRRRGRLRGDILSETPGFVPKHRYLIAWRKLYKVARVVLIVATFLFWISGRYSVRLPEPRELLPAVGLPPVQSADVLPIFEFDWRSESFTVTPQAKYEITGLVVSHNNVGGIGDIYHSADAVDLKDLCIVWGTTALEGHYREVLFWSEPWSCHYTSKGGEDSIDPSELSNNHLLAGTPAIAETIRGIRVGDQVRASGYLIDYSPKDSPESLRRSSLVRDDTGDGACEVVFVTSFSLLKAANRGWRTTQTVSYYILLLTAAITLLSWFVLPYLEYKLE